VGEAAEPERDALDALDQVVDGFGRPVAHLGLVPGGDLGGPPNDRAAELGDLGWARVVLEVDTEPLDELDCQVGVGDAVDRPHDFLGVPGHAHSAARVARLREPEQLLLAAVVETLVRAGEQTSGSVERIVLAAPVPEGLSSRPSTECRNPHASGTEPEALHLAPAA
jgi:hypothetical protein